MAYADDKRIRELQTGSSMPLNWRLPFDFTGLAAAEYRTLQQVIDTVNDNLELPEITSGASNPDNAFGNDGDTYYKFVSGSVFSVWVKALGAWGMLFEIDLDTSIAPITFTSDASGEYDFTSEDLPEYPGVTLYENGQTTPATFDNTTKKLIFLNPSTSYTVKFS
jgi:hypothetical protein